MPCEGYIYIERERERESLCAMSREGLRAFVSCDKLWGRVPCEGVCSMVCVCVCVCGCVGVSVCMWVWE